MADATMPQTPETQGTLLFVDDEPNIAASLKRLFRPLGYRIFTAESGAQGLDVVAQEKIDLVISDMRMPEMDGAQFLQRVRLESPDSIRILLTGYADISSTIAAINQGQIYRYISKPWDDNDITITVRHALERKRLEQEKARLEVLTRQQNEELKVLNASLEEKVQARTAELSNAMQRLEAVHDKLKKSFINSIRIFSNMLELREGGVAGHSRRVADCARRLAIKMGMPEQDAQEIMLAGLLHDIGMIGLSDRILAKPFNALTPDEREAFIKHPIKGQMALMGLEQFAAVGCLVRSHHERFDGQGYPEQLRGDAILPGARILAIANDYDELQTGMLTGAALGPGEALAHIIRQRGKHYDPVVVDAFVELMGKSGVNASEMASAADSSARSVGRGVGLSTGQLKSGMVLARDLVTDEGMLLLSKEYVLDDKLIEQLRGYESISSHSLTVYVCDGR
ncbi:cyclic di-GMP phosphodiesterase response regulator RpfG [mine drainage metagenome]|uniref:Cyclic di-GMP phosphodiesterase response regulator RpfG n=1 Tax=mine drainage metagenome TaxID=410659 RepID=A0A1J5Q9N3_9ZZZZ